MAPKKDKPKYTANDLRGLLRTQYGDEGYVVMEEVSDAAGFERSRSADMMVMGLWPSRGLLLEGIEIKVSRADWLAELKDPSKAEAFARYCDRWWLVVSDPDIVKEGELPVNWGLKAVVGGRLRVINTAPALKAEPLSRHLLAALLKRATKANDSFIKEQVESKVRAGMEQMERRLDYQHQNTRSALETLQNRVHEFERRTGLRVNHLLSPEHAGLLRAVMGMGQIELPDPTRLVRSIEDLKNSAAQVLWVADRLQEGTVSQLKKVHADLDEVKLKLKESEAGVTSLVGDSSRYGTQTVGTGHVFRLPCRDVMHNKARSTRGFFRFWEPPLVGSTCTRGTKKRPSERRTSDVEAPPYRLEAVAAIKDGDNLELVYTERPHTCAEWDLIAALPEGWRPKFEYARNLGVTLPVDDRAHLLWAVPVTMDIPMEHLGEWVMSGTVPVTEDAQTTLAEP